MLIWTNRWRRFFRLRLWLILKNNDINMFNNFQFFFRSVFIFVNCFFEMNISFNRFFFCIIQLSQNVETHFESTIKNFSTNIVSKSKKFLISKIKIRFLRFFQFVIQISIWFLNDDCFNVWNFSCIYSLIWSSIFLYLMIKIYNIFLMKTNINFERMYVLIETRIASFILSIFSVIFAICFFFRLYSFTHAW